MTISHSITGATLPALQAAVDSIPVVIFSAGTDGKVAFVNRRWTELTGLPTMVALEYGWLSLVHPDDRARLVTVSRRSFANNKAWATDVRIRRADGTYFWLNTRAAPIADVNGVTTQWYGAAIDIDARKRAEETLVSQEALLRGSERRLEMISEALPAICWTANAQGWTDWYNRRWFEYTGQPVAEALGWGWQAMHHSEDFMAVMTKWPDSIATGERFEMEFRLRRYDGVFCWFLARAEPLKDEHGRVVRWYGTFVDIEMQRQAHERTKLVASTLQNVFLPERLPEIQDVQFDAIYLPAEKDALVGGDWYDAFELPDRRVMFSIGDVAGHGLTASVLVGRLRQAILTLALRIDDPADILSELNYILALDRQNTMVTAIVGFINPSHTEIAYASAGHPPPMVTRPGTHRTETLPLGGLPLGIADEQHYQTSTFDVVPGTTVALYTDGMIEFTRNALAGEARMGAALALLAGNKTIVHPARAIQELIFNDAPATDDAALLIIEFGPAQNTDAAGRTDLARAWRFHSSDALVAHLCRREIGNYFRAFASEDSDTAAAELVVGELIANVVRHAPSLVDVSIDWLSDEPVVTVRDHGRGVELAPRTSERDTLSETGRGLFLVRRLARAVSHQDHPGDGTELRVQLKLRRAFMPQEHSENARAPR